MMGMCGAMLTVACAGSRWWARASPRHQHEIETLREPHELGKAAAERERGTWAAGRRPAAHNQFRDSLTEDLASQSSSKLGESIQGAVTIKGACGP